MRQSYSHFIEKETKAKRCDLPEAIFTSQPARLTPEPKPRSLLCARSVVSLCDPVDYSPRDASVHGISQAGTLERSPVPPPGSFLALWLTFLLLKLCYFDALSSHYLKQSYLLKSLSTPKLGDMENYMTPEEVM